MITYADKDKNAPLGTPEKHWRDIDANEVKESVNALDITREAVAISAGVLTLNQAGKEANRFVITDPVGANFTVAQQNITKLEVFTLDFNTSTAIDVIFPSGFSFANDDRWDDGTKVLSLDEGPIEVSVTYDGTIFKGKCSGPILTTGPKRDNVEEITAATLAMDPAVDHYIYLGATTSAFTMWGSSGLTGKNVRVTNYGTDDVTVTRSGSDTFIDATGTVTSVALIPGASWVFRCKGPKFYITL